MENENKIKELVDEYAKACKDYDKTGIANTDQYNRVTYAMKKVLRAILDENGYADVRIVL